MRETLPVVAGTLVSQTLLNLLALLLLAVVVVGSNDILRGHEGVLILVSLLPLALTAAVLIVPSLVEASRRAGFGSRREGTLARMAREAAAALVRLRKGLTVFRRPRSAAWATSAQLAAWGLQLLGAFALLLALELDHRAGLGAAAAVLFAVNVTAVLPATPSNVGLFQIAVVTVLTGAYGVPAAAALGYGIILQAVEVATAVLFGLPGADPRGRVVARRADARSGRDAGRAVAAGLSATRDALGAADASWRATRARPRAAPGAGCRSREHRGRGLRIASAAAIRRRRVGRLRGAGCT